jgi:putative addiction module component (TIGR02574 family)
MATPPGQLTVHNRDSIQYIAVCVLPVYNIVMKTTIDTIIAEVLSLSPQARAFVAEKLIESLDSEPEVTLSSAWREEVRKRCREVDEGSVELRDAEDVFARGYTALG